MPRGASDAALCRYHVDRRSFRDGPHAKIELLDAERIARAIEFTRFPSHAWPDEDNEEGLLVRAADLIGQLGDPHYLRKANALYFEFEEVGMNRQLGYTSPADLTDLYPQFYWNSVSPHIQSAIRYLNVTSSGRRWIANLYSNVFRAERDLSLCGPQRLVARHRARHDSVTPVDPSLLSMIAGEGKLGCAPPDARELVVGPHDPHCAGELERPHIAKPGRPRSPLSGLAALGIVFGDIGTSPLYTLKTVLDFLGGDATPAAPRDAVADHLDADRHHHGQIRDHRDEHRQ